MEFANRISQTLHDEHQATVVLMERLERFLGQHRRTPPSNDRDVTRLLDDLAQAIGAEIDRHFTFEEEQLFTYLDTIGDGAIGAHLAEEHAAMRPIGNALA